MDSFKPGFYAAWWMRNIPCLNLFAYLEDSEVSQRVVEGVMLKFYGLDLNSNRFSQQKLGEGMSLVAA
ncbi:MAG TPA: hypothetical protein VIR01_08035 [Pyrinomonadaceae bacterium]